MPALILSHETALAWWRSPEAGIPTHATALSPEQAHGALSATAGSVHARLIDELQDENEEFSALPAPLDLLTADRNDRRNTRRARFHCMQTELPPGSLLLWKELAAQEESVRIYLPTPEFCFVQMAHHLDDIGLSELGCELCGSYRGTSGGTGGASAHDVPPLTSPEKLLAYAESAEQMTGAKRARKVAGRLIAGAHSPQQAKLALMASLPRSMGGIGTPKPQLDHVIEIPDAIARVLGSRTRRPDLFWPEISTAVEYENRMWNDASAHAEYEARKADAYHRMGLEVISITRSQLENLDATRRIFEIIVRACGKRRKPANARQVARQEATHRALFETSGD